MRLKFPNNVENLFNQMDTNMDSQLTQEEVQNYMLSTGFTFKASDISDFWAQADHNKDGLLTVKEIKQMLLNQDAAASLYTKNEKVNLIFYYYDLNKDNFLNVNEVQKILQDAYGMSNINDAQWFLG